MKKTAVLLSTALLLAGTPVLAGGFGHYDFGNVIRYTDRSGDWSVSVRLGDGGKHHYRGHDRRHWAPPPKPRWIPPGQLKKRERDYGRGFRHGYQEGFRDGYAAAPCYETRYDRKGRRIRVELPGRRCR